MITWHSDTTLPLVGTAQEASSNAQLLPGWLLANKDSIQQLLYKHGAILFHGFGVNTSDEFQNIASIFCEKFSDYVGGNSPRTKVKSHVFTSTEYPKEGKISMHNEASYLAHMPGTILFFCAKPAA